MRHLFILAIGIILLNACASKSTDKNNTVKVKSDQVTATAKPAVLTVDQLYEKAAELEGEEIVVTGTVMHVCKHGGARCFIMGSNEDINIRIEAGEKIGAFGQELMGSDIQVAGVLREVRTEAEAHNPNREHGTDKAEHNEDKETENAHQIIAESIEKAKVVYFIEGIRSKEL